MVKFNVIITNQKILDSYITKFTQEELNDEEWRCVSNISNECLLKIGNNREYVLKYITNYYVSNLGRVARISENNDLILKSAMKDKFDYLHVDLYYIIPSETKTKVSRFFIHQLVGFLFNSEKYSHEKYQINHLDEIHYNNRSNNLSWCDGKENTNYGTGIERAAKQRKISNNKNRKIEESKLSDEEKRQLKNKRINQTHNAVKASIKVRRRGITRINIITNERVNFIQMSDAVLDSNCDEGTIRRSMKNNIIVKNKYKFMYTDEGQVNNKRDRAIVQLDLYSHKFIHCFKNICEIKNTGVNISRISKCCNGKIKSTEGFIWMFLDDYLKLMNIETLNDLSDSEIA